HRYTIRRKIITLLGAKFHIYDESSSLIGYVRQKAFRLREDLRVYTDATQSTELLAIRARRVIDFAASYDVTETASGEKIGGLRRRGIRSLLRDEWLVLDPQDQHVASLMEDSTAMALARRFLPLANLVPQTFHLRDDGRSVLAEFQTHFNPFVHKMTVTVHP